MATGSFVIDLTGNTDGDVICSLLKQPFSKRNSEGKLALLKRNRPKPSLEVFVKSNSKSVQESTSYFDVWIEEYDPWWYTNFEWLCGSREKNMLYCWPCILFHDNENMFTRGAELEQNCLTAAAQAHDITDDHKRCVATMQKERERLGLSPQQKVVGNTCSHQKEDTNKDVVKRNRELFKKLITVVMVLYNVDCALPFILSSDRTKFKTMFDLSIQNDSYLREYCDELGEVYHNVVTSVFMDIMVCIKHELQCFLTNELVGSKTHPFWSLQVDGANCINGKHYISLLLRYVDASGKLQERHLGFSSHGIKSAENLFKCISSCTGPIAHIDYLVSYSYDGACISVAELIKLQKKVTSVATGAVLVPSSDHSLSTVLLDGISNMDGPCRVFAFILQDFLIHDLDNTTFLFESLNVPVRPSENALLILNSNLLQHVLNNRKHLIDCYEEKRLSMDVPPEHLNKLLKFCNNLRDAQFVSFILVLKEILKATNEISIVLDRDSTNVKTCSNLTKRAIEKIKQISSVQLASDAYFTVTGLRKRASGNKAIDDIVSINNSVIENVVSQLSVRYGNNCRQLAFLTLVDSTKFASHNKSFPENALASLNRVYEKHFKEEWLRDELKIFIYNDRQFYNKSPLGIMRLLIANDMQELLPQSFKLFCLVATMPIWPGTFLNSNCFERTNELLRESPRFGAEALFKSDMSSVIIDRPTVRLMAAEDSWHDKLIKRYAAEKNDYHLDLEFKE